MIIVLKFKLLLLFLFIVVNGPVELSIGIALGCIVGDFARAWNKYTSKQTISSSKRVSLSNSWEGKSRWRHIKLSSHSWVEPSLTDDIKYFPLSGWLGTTQWAKEGWDHMLKIERCNVNKPPTADEIWVQGRVNANIVKSRATLIIYLMQNRFDASVNAF